MEGKHGAGKGDTYRSVNYEVWSKNWDAIFNKESNAKGRKSNRRKNHQSISRRETGKKS